PANRGTTLASTGPRGGVSLGCIFDNFRYSSSNLTPPYARDRITSRAASLRGRTMRAIHPDADANATPIRARLRAARTGQGLSLGRLAETTGLSKGFLSRVERDETSPSVATLVQLCQVLSLPIGSLFAEPEIQRVTYADAPRINLGGVHAEERLMSPRSEHRVQLLRSELAPDAHGGKELYTINCDVEVLHVVKGTVVVRF